MLSRASGWSRRTTVPVVLAAVLALLAIGSVAAAGKSSQVYWKNFGKPASTEPVKVEINFSTGYAWVSNLTEWDGWGTASASAQGTIHINTCRPYCAAGNYKAYRGRVTLSKVRQCNGQRRYLTVKIKPNGQPTASWGSDCRGAQVVAP